MAVCNARLCVRSLCCPTLCFDVVFPINCVLYVCMLPLLSFPLSGAVCSNVVVCRRFVMLCHWSNWSVFARWVFLLFVFFSCFCSLLLFSLNSDCEFTSFLRSLLFKAVFLFVEVSLCAVCLRLIVVSLVVLHEYLVNGCGGLLGHWCITASHPHKARKFPHAGSQSSPAALWEAFWTSFSLLL